MAQTIDLLAAAPRWTPARLHALPGRCRGDLIGPWGTNVVARFGADALVRVRARLGAPLDALAPALTDDDWLPAGTQVAVTEAIVDELLAGDLRALYPLLVADTRASVNRVQLAVARTLGAKRVFRMAPRAFRKVYDRGAVEVVVDATAPPFGGAAGQGRAPAVGGRRARLAFRDHPLFANPTWRVLQLCAMRTLLELAGTPGDAIGDDDDGDGDGADSFVAVASW